MGRRGRRSRPRPEGRGLYPWSIGRSFFDSESTDLLEANHTEFRAREARWRARKTGYAICRPRRTRRICRQRRTRRILESSSCSQENVGNKINASSQEYQRYPSLPRPPTTTKHTSTVESLHTHELVLENIAVVRVEGFYSCHEHRGHDRNIRTASIVRSKITKTTDMSEESVRNERNESIPPKKTRMISCCNRPPISSPAEQERRLEVDYGGRL